MRFGVVEALLMVYKYAISPFIHILAGPGFGCRFEPTCSTYCVDAVRQHGLRRGIGLSIFRILRCQPWGGRAGADPVPAALSRQRT